jgi:hypothetical protein
VTINSLIESLLAASRSGDFESIASLPGAGVHRLVIAFSSQLREETLASIASMPVNDRTAFAKAVAAYENTVGGIGSPTALVRVLPLLPDDGREALDWILVHTESYSYYSYGARSFEELQRLSSDRASARSARQAENARNERERAEEARAGRAERATANLFNAVRRGDSKALVALLNDGASADAVTPDGAPLVDYAISIGRADLAELLRARINR